MKLNSKIIFYLICLLFFSCSSSEEGYIPSSGSIQVAISVTLPEPEEVLSRAYTDKDIKNVTVLVYDQNNKFMERIDVDESDIAPEAGGIRFNIVIDATPDDRTLHLIANARTPDGNTDRIDFSGLATTKTEAETIPLLETNPITGTGATALLDQITPLIMWGRATLHGVNVTTNVDNVKLLRSVACVRVKKGTTTASNGLADFMIDKLAVHNAAGQGYVAPSAYYSAVTTTPATGNPHSAARCDYTKAWSQTDAEPFAYVYETDYAAGHYTSVILSASYKGQAGYYKIGLADDNSNPLSVLRNYRYTIAILSVNGPGYADVATAASSVPANDDLLKVQITIGETERYPFVIADSQHWMGLSNNIFFLVDFSNRATIPDVELCTVWSDSGTMPVITDLPPGLTVNVTGTGSPYRVMGTFSGAVVPTTVTIRCDNLSLPLRVEYSGMASVPGLVEDGDSYAFAIFGSPDSWRVWIPDPLVNDHIHLHPSDRSAGALTANSGAGMVTELTSKYAQGSYLHVHRSSNRLDELWATAYSQGEIVVAKFAIAQ